MSMSGGFTSLLGTAGGLANSAYNIYNAYDSARQAQQNYDNAASAINNQSAISKEQMELARDQWNRYQNVFGPVDEMLASEQARDLGLYRPLKEAQVASAITDIALYTPLKQQAAQNQLAIMQGQQPIRETLLAEAQLGAQADESAAMGLATANVRESFSKHRTANARKRQSMGLDTKQAAWMNALEGLEEAGAEASARTMAAENERERALNLYQNTRNTALGLNDGSTALRASSYSAPSVRPSANPLDAAADLMQAAASSEARNASNFAQLGLRPADPLQYAAQQGLSGAQDLYTLFFE